MDGFQDFMANNSLPILTKCEQVEEIFKSVYSEWDRIRVLDHLGNRYQWIKLSTCCHLKTSWVPLGGKRGNSIQE